MSIKKRKENRYPAYRRGDYIRQYARNQLVLGHASSILLKKHINGHFV